MRHACGLAVGAAEVSGRAGARASDFQSLRAYFAARPSGFAWPGEALGAAFLHLIDPTDPLDAPRLAVVNAELAAPVDASDNLLETLIALDWCWDAVDIQARQNFLLEMRRRAEPLTPADSPLEVRAFRRKLETLALAAVVDTEDDSTSSWAELRGRIVAAADEYLAQTLPTFMRWRGLAPTSPAAGPYEESGIAVLLELAGVATGRNVWPDHARQIGRWLEHYVYASFSHPALQHHFVRDDGRDAPLSPASRWDELLPLTAHLIATRTRDPAAAFIARRVEQRLRGPAAEPLARPWQWTPVVFDTAGLTKADFARLPRARNFGGAVVFRDGSPGLESAVWIEAGQPYLRRRQHFDAGHFLIYAGGHLTTTAGVDVSFEAVPSKGGEQRLGRRPGPFEWEQFFTSTIAHNCLLLWDPIRVPRWYGRIYEPAGGQRLIEGTCEDFTGDLRRRERETGRQLAYGQNAYGGYLGLDLTPAYDPRELTGYTREFLFVDGRVLVVIDRVSGTHGLSDPIWVVNLPARPTIGGAELPSGRGADAISRSGLDLPTEYRVSGSDDMAGVWQCGDAEWLSWCDGEACMRMFPLMPVPAHVRVVGGPQHEYVIPGGPYEGRRYFGSGPEGFERLVRPAGRSKAENAWYRLGEPTLLGPAFWQSPHWGRVEIEPVRTGDVTVFVTVLAVVDAGQPRAPGATLGLAEAAAEPRPVSETQPVEVESEPRSAERGLAIELDSGGRRFALEIPEGMERGGRLRPLDPAGEAWLLPQTVESDAELAVE